MPKNYVLLLLSVIALLQGCAVAPPVCPKLPERPVLAPPEKSFQQMTQRLLQGLPPEPTPFELTSKPAVPGFKP